MMSIRIIQAIEDAKARRACFAMPHHAHMPAVSQPSNPWLHSDCDFENHQVKAN